MRTRIQLDNLTLLTKNTPKLILLSCLGYVSTSYATTEEIVAGKTLLAKGLVNAVNPETNNVRALKRRSKIMSVDHITTGKNSKAQFSMSDGGLITLKENTEISVSNYEFDKDTQKGSATLEVLSGGLRSISGLIKKTGGDYQVKTPVGSIGIRGTHFAVEVAGDDVYFGVYSGNIDIVLNNNQSLSLGVTEGFAFASVNQSGEITSFTQAPEILSLGYSSSQEATENVTPEENDNTASTDIITETAPSTIDISETSTADGAAISDEYAQIASENNDQEIIDKIENIEDIQTIAELISERIGTFDYQQVTESNINSSVGDVNGLSMNLAVDFDNGTIPGGSLSFTDAQGEWFATYSGLINVDQLELGVNFASHANKHADGNISANFSDGLDEITGNFDLQEIEDTNVNATGSFKIK